MRITQVAEEFYLGVLEGFSSREGRILELSVECRDKLRRRLVVNGPRGMVSGTSFLGNVYERKIKYTAPKATDTSPEIIVLHRLVHVEHGKRHEDRQGDDFLEDFSCARLSTR